MDTIAFVRASLVRMLDETTKALPESLLWEIAEKMPDLADLATKVICLRYPGSVEVTSEPVTYTAVALHCEEAGEREGLAMERFSELLDDAAATVNSLPDDPGQQYLASSLRRARKATAQRDNVATRAHRFAKLEGKTMLPRYPRQKFIRWWDATCEAIENQLPLPRPTELPLCLEDYARRAMNRLRKQMIRTGKMDREQVKIELDKIRAQADKVPLSQFVAEARAKLSA